MPRKIKSSGSRKIDGMPRLVREGQRTRLVVGGKPFVALGGEVQNSSASDAEYMAGVWRRLAAMHYNTVLAPVYWELVEPAEGRFDFSLVRSMIAGARAQGLRLILLWFGTWKNGESTYTPAWIKRDLKRFPRGQTEPGRNTRAVSAFSQACLAADARAFAVLMRFLRADDRHHTVIMVQVENEAGFLGAARDRCAAADRAFESPLPKRLAAAMVAQRETLHPDIQRAWSDAGGRETGTWREVFGAAAEEIFMAWHVAEYIENVAAAGKAEYPLPMFVNAWLNYGEERPGSGGTQPGVYPSGGPVARMHDIWRIAAPSIDAFAPDIYSPWFKEICRDFVRNGNVLIIPECKAQTAAAHVFWAVAEHNACCFAPFGIDRPHPWGPSIPSEAPGLADSYRMLADMLPILAPHLGTPRVRGILQSGDERDTLTVGGLTVEIDYERKLADAIAPACGLIAITGANEAYVAGRGFSARFIRPADSREQIDILLAESGDFVRGRWKPRMRLNGDDTCGKWIQLKFLEAPEARRGVLYTHA